MMIRLLLALTLLLAPASLAAQQKTSQPKSAAKTPQRATQQKTAPARKPAAKTSPAKPKASSAAAVPTTPQIRKLQGESAALRKQITESETLLRSHKKSVEAGLSNLHLLNAQIGQQRSYVEGIESETRALSIEIDTLERRLAVLEADLQRAKQQYSRALMYMFRNRLGQSKWMFIFSARSYRELYRRTRYVTEYGRYRRMQGEEIRKKEEAVRKRRAALQSAHAEKQRLLAEGRNQQRKLEDQKEERSRMVADLQSKQKKLQSVLATQRKQQQTLNARIDALIQKEIEAAERRRREEEARRRAEAERRRREQQAAAARSSGSGSAKDKTAAPAAAASGRTATPDFRSADAADRALSTNFAANRGRLPVPITGPYSLTARYGQNRVEGLSGVQLDNKGINLTGRPGAEARSIFDGEVTAVFTLGGMYNVIVRHGSYISVYCNLSRCSVRRGQKVSTRQSLGSVAPDASGNCTLHFQLRKEAEKLNPEQWIAR